MATIDAGGTAVNGLVFSTHGFPTPGTPTGDFWNKYKKVYGQTPDSIFAATGYDLIKVVAAAVTKAKSTDPVAVRNALDQLVNVPVLTGPITYLGQHGIPLANVYLVQITDGNFVLLGKRVPKASEIPAP